MSKNILVVLICFLIFPFIGYSQLRENRYSTKTQEEEVKGNNGKLKQSSDAISNKLPGEVEIKEAHSPHKATIYSMVLPGLGQIYNKQWWKVPIVYGGLIGTYIAADWNHKTYKKYQGAFVDYTQQLEYEAGNGEPPVTERWKDVILRDVSQFTESEKEWLRTTLKNKKDNYKRDRDFMYIIMAGVYVLNMIDATVSAHFLNFDINDDLTMKIQPNLQYNNMAGNSVGINCILKF